MLELWDKYFPNCEPIAPLMREKFSDRWVRFHSLPDSKRYAENEAEYVTVLDRHNHVLGELAKDGEYVALLTADYSSSENPIRSNVKLVELDPGALPWRSIPFHEFEDDFSKKNYWHVFVSQQCWTPGRFDGLIRLVADDFFANIMIVPLDCKWLLHPYDGGMDVILESIEVRNLLRAQFSEWLSVHPSGL